MEVFSLFGILAIMQRDHPYFHWFFFAVSKFITIIHGPVQAAPSKPLITIGESIYQHLFAKPMPGLICLWGVVSQTSTDVKGAHSKGSPHTKNCLLMFLNIVTIIWLIISVGSLCSLGDT